MTYRLTKQVDEYETSEKILAEVSAALQKGSEPPKLTVREFLTWFGAQRRGPNIVSWIDELLANSKLETLPSYISTYIDDDISIVRASLPEVQPQEEANHVELADPVLRIGSLKSERTSPTTVSPTDPLSHAVTLMMVNDYSQLPVITTPREIKGIISWKSIGERLAAKAAGSEVRNFIEPAYVVNHDDSFFRTLPGIIENQYVLVRGQDNALASIVTTTDLSNQFLQMTEPFLLLNEIENHVRILLQRWADLTKSKVASVCKLDERYNDVFDLSFGDYLRIFESHLIKDPFPLNIDRAAFCKTIDQVRLIRNDVMHFSADPTPADAISSLRKTSEYLRKLQALSS